jgi:uncharacterized UPF0160 family protein
LIWDHYGVEFLKHLGVPDDRMEEIWNEVEHNFVIPFDAHDNGVVKLNKSDHFVMSVKKKIPTGSYEKDESGNWVPSFTPQREDYYNGYIAAMKAGNKRLKSYVHSLLQKDQLDPDNLHYAALNVLKLALFNVAGKKANINADKIQAALNGTAKVKSIHIQDTWKGIKTVLLNNLGTHERFHSKMDRKVLRSLLTKATLESDVQPALMPMIKHSLLAYHNSPDFEQKLMEVIQYASDTITDFIKNNAAAASGHELVDDVIKAAGDNHPGYLVLPGSAEYVTGVTIYNAIHKDNPIKAVVYPLQQDGETRWNAKQMNVRPGTFETYEKFPEGMRGKIGDAIAEGAGLPHMKGQFIFCHNAGFLCVARSKEAAILAIEMSS